MDLEILKALHDKNEWFKPKHISMYRDIVFRAAQESAAVRRKTGAVILSPNGSIFLGYNGTPANTDNCCETHEFVTKDNVIHAEQNAFNKMYSEHLDPKGSIIFITDSPCSRCVNEIIKNEISAVFYFRLYRDLEPVYELDRRNIITQYVDENYLEELRLKLIDERR